jgi:hypothetical protein
MKQWRCELTALSQRFNYYFVACNEELHVYQPSFPDQIITGSPSIILQPPRSQDNIDAALYEHTGIDENHPHSINRILVDYLGNDEILLVACDDGDVIVYRVEELQIAIEARAEGSRAQAAKDVRIFLHRNIRSTAWGIAVHREARMIAFSANTHKVTIIAFALSDRRQNQNKSDISDTLSDAESDFPSQRKRDHTFELQAKSNIPSVSFDNTSKDPGGRWLFSSCIDGQTIVFDLHQKKANATLQIGWCVSARNGRSSLSDGYGCHCMDKWNFPHAAWGAMFLDTSSAHRLDGPEELETERRKEVPCWEDASMQKKRFAMEGRNRSESSHVVQANHGSPMLVDEDVDDSDLDAEALAEPSNILSANSTVSAAEGTEDEDESEDSEDIQPGFSHPLLEEDSGDSEESLMGPSQPASTLPAATVSSMPHSNPPLPEYIQPQFSHPLLEASSSETEDSEDSEDSLMGDLPTATVSMIYSNAPLPDGTQMSFVSPKHKTHRPYFDVVNNTTTNTNNRDQDVRSVQAPLHSSLKLTLTT